MTAFTTLIDPAALASQCERENLVVFDCRFDLGNTAWGETEFSASHIPGAQYLHLDRDLAAKVHAASGRHPLPDPHIFAARMGLLGVGSGCQVVAYDQGNGAYAARLWWLLRWIGFPDVAVLNGGFAAWRAEGFPVTTEVRTPVARSLPVALDPNAWITTEMLDELRRLPGNLLIDARSEERFAGRNETIDPVAGHVPGARNLPFARNLDAHGKFLPAEALKTRWGVLLGSLPPAAVIAMCGSGITACHDLLALEHAGMKGARLYAGSWSEWIRDPRRPIATGPH
jgi:thiosulfate/3-mercaptopyruvate sulfurtransferase